MSTSYHPMDQHQHQSTSSGLSHIPPSPPLDPPHHLQQQQQQQQYQNSRILPNSPPTIQNQALAIGYPGSPRTNAEMQDKYAPRNYHQNSHSQLNSPVGSSYREIVSDHELEFPQYYPPRLPEPLPQHNEEAEEAAEVEYEELTSNPKPFVSKLAHLLNSPDLYSDVIKWDAVGTTVIILPSERFTGSILPEFFSHNSVAAFNRQLNTYGFSHLSRHQVAHRFSPNTTTVIKEMAGWTHPFFTRDDQSRLSRILPKPSKVREAHRKSKMALLLEEGKSGKSLRSKLEDKSKAKDQEGWHRIS